MHRDFIARLLGQNILLTGRDCHNQRLYLTAQEIRQRYLQSQPTVRIQLTVDILTLKLCVKLCHLYQSTVHFLVV